MRSPLWKMLAHGHGGIRLTSAKLFEQLPDFFSPVRMVKQTALAADSRGQRSRSNEPWPLTRICSWSAMKRW